LHWQRGRRDYDGSFHPPSELVFKEDTVKVTLALSRRSVDFFKNQAKKHDTQYQKMVRRLLDFYVSRQMR